jgi:16S rRNA processing protein RimM
MPSARSRRVLLGRILRAHGNRGEVAILAYTAKPRDIAAYGPLADADGALLTITQIRTTAKGVVARLKGIADRTAAEALKGVELYVDRDRLPAPADGEFYHTDLIGLAVVDREGRTLGNIVAVQNFGAGDLIEVGMPGSRTTQFVPFTEAHVPEVDIRGGRVVVAPPSLGEDEAE